jgi:hypothetical protein
LLLQLTEHPPDAPVKVVSADDFFARATQEEDWHDEEERETVKRFQNKVSVLKQNLSQLQVYRVGSIDIDAYIVGLRDGGELADQNLFPEVRSFEAFKYLHMGDFSDIKRKTLPKIAKIVGLDNHQALHIF